MAIKGRKNNNAARAKKAASSAKKKAPAPGTRKSLRIKGAKPEFSPSELEKVNKDVRERSHLNYVMGVVFNSADDDDSVEETFPNWDCQGCQTSNSHDEARCIECNQMRTGTVSANGWAGFFTTSRPQWTCQICTSRNNDVNARCTACNNSQGSWPCVNCNQANTESAKVCEECSVPKGMWQCSACNTHNNTSTQECIDCGTRFGAESQGNTETSVSSSPTVGGFVFRAP
mmetsp:Transcript_5250/g.10802  ORF Transcript_5250/g.10802 Transcript_5250/m.10802 type:complete len:230 (-) Transcript_5250:200-889(-)